MSIDEYIKLGKEVEDNENCPYCNKYVIQHLDEIYLCPNCGATLIYNFSERKWEDEIEEQEEEKK